jgi:transcriptional regulator with XRE-family HTH domain
MIGDQIRELRRKKGISLTDLAQQTGLSKSMLSQVERGLSNLSVEKIRSLAEALQVPVFTLFLDAHEFQGMLVKKGKRIALCVPDSNATRELLTPDLNRAMLLVIARIPPHECSSPTLTTHLGEECLFILRGRINFQLQDEFFALETGDSFYFDARVPHKSINPDNTEAEFLSVVVPATLERRQV